MPILNISQTFMNILNLALALSPYSRVSDPTIVTFVLILPFFFPMYEHFTGLEEEEQPFHRNLFDAFSTHSHQ